MDASEIRDEESFRAWLDTLPERVGEGEARRIAVWLASRAALRAWPLAWDFRTVGDLNAVLTPLPVLRCLVISSIERTLPADDIRLAVAAAQATADPVKYHAYAYAKPSSPINIATACADAVYAATLAASSTANAAFATKAAAAAVDAVNASLFATTTAESWQAISLDAQTDGAKSTPRLWPNGAPGRWPSFADPPDAGWQFWIDWYDDILNGRPQNWPMLTEIALIAPEHWDAGPDVVNPMIALIAEKYRLMAEAAALKEQVRQARTALHDLERRAHNNPPELVDEGVAEARQAITLIWEALDEAETELAKADPAPSKLKAIGARLIELGRSFVVYCGGKLDIALTVVIKEAAKTGTKWSIGLGATYFTAQQPQVQSLGKALMDLAAKWGGG